jgi:flagellar biosynthesis regulator FlbT
MDNPVLAWYVSATPWKDCPFDLQMVVITGGGPEKAQELFKKFYKNEAVAIKSCVIINLLNEKDADMIIDPLEGANA